MENLQKACDQFRDSHKDLFSANSGYTVGYGLDPARRGPNGIIVYAMSNDLRQQDEMIRTVRSSLPPNWTGFPVYFKGVPFVKMPAD